MKRLVVALLPLLPLTALAEGPSLEALKKRCAEQERQIRQLEEENSRLRDLTGTAEKTVIQKAPEASSMEEAQAAPEPRYHTVVAGDTLSRIARKHGTTPQVIAKLNDLKSLSLIRPGQKLALPALPEAPKAKAVPAEKPTKTTPPPTVNAAEPAEQAPAKRTATHTIKDGETFFGIARKYGLSIDALASANPGIDPRAIKVGQTLNLVSRPDANTLSKKAMAPPSAEGSLLTESSSQPVTHQPLIRSVRIVEEITFGDFAERHGMDPAKLNALNGLHLQSKTVLAKESELYVYSRR